MKVFLTNYKIQLFIFLFLTIYCAIDEGNIFIPMTSNFTLEHSQNKINNKKKSIYFKNERFLSKL